jgi:uncharacterized OB-fold protein
MRFVGSATVPASRPIAPGLFMMADDGPRLVAGRCEPCGRLHFPATATCPYCGHAACRDVGVGPAARLFLFTVVQSQPPGYRGPLPFGFGVVELSEGLRVVTRLTEARLDRLHEGLSMSLVVEPLFTEDDGTAVLSYAFAPAA